VRPGGHAPHESGVMAVAYHHGNRATHVGQFLPQGLQFGLVPAADGKRESTLRATVGKMVRGAAPRGPGRAP
jgi:hypothetical protein